MRFIPFLVLLALAVPSLTRGNNDAVLAQRPSHGPAYAGALPIGTIRGEKFFLVSKEAYGPHAGTWSDFGGHVELQAQGGFESYGSTLLRELKEESAGVYRLNLSALKDAKLIFKKNVLMGIVPVPYKSREALKAARKRQTDFRYREKDDFYWIQAGHFLSQLKALPKNPDHTKLDVTIWTGSRYVRKKLLFRSYFLKTLIEGGIG